MQIRLYDWQVEYLRNHKSGSKVLAEAYQRYEQGKMSIIVAKNSNKKKNKQKVPHLLPFSIKKRFPVSDALMREILKKHIEVPDQEQINRFQMEKEKLEKQINSELKILSEIPFIEE